MRTVGSSQIVSVQPSLPMDDSYSSYSSSNGLFYLYTHKKEMKQFPPFTNTIVFLCYSIDKLFAIEKLHKSFLHCLIIANNQRKTYWPPITLVSSLPIFWVTLHPKGLNKNTTY